jgi:thioesterase domain-containing protein
VTADEVVGDLLAAGRVPVLLVGWSMGGVIGWEVATRLAARGHLPGLVLIDTSPLRRAPHPETDEAILARLVTMLGPNPGPEAQDRLRRVFQAQVVALSGHQLADSYPGRVLLLLCSDADREAQRGEWVDVYGRLTTQLRTDRLDAGHFEVFDPPHFPDLATHLRDFVPATVRNGGNR